MPKLVDHDQRRETICFAAAKLIHAEGLEAATVRAIARAAGCSTGVLAHYFTDKDDLVAHVLAYVNRRPLTRVVQRLESDTDATSIVPWLDEALPLDDERRMEWSVRFAIWGFQPNLQSFAPSGEQSWLEGARDLAVLGQARGLVPQALDPDVIATRLIAAVMGASVCMMLEPTRFDAAWLRDYMAHSVGDLMA